jgi:BirA family biotin operon repressor/biotin-[acetyl-CoA-carboxylase] ligase
MPPQPILAPLMGLAIYEAAQTVFTGVAFSLKAPNDLYIGDKKVAGLLIETVVAGESAKTIIGLGLNVHAHPETLTTSTALNEHADARLTAELFQTFLDALLKNMTAAIRLGQNRKLEFSERARLKDALNRNPLLAEPVLELDALGQIRTASKTITWQEQ